VPDLEVLEDRVGQLDAGLPAPAIEEFDLHPGLASVEGLDGPTVARLAAALDVSKSGVFAHFGSKEELQVAVIDTARDAFAKKVVGMLRETRPRVGRLWAICDVRLRYMETAHPGGCFFYGIAAEFDARPDPIRDRAAAARLEWLTALRRVVTEARDTGQLLPTVDSEALAFELDAFAQAANGDAALLQDPGLGRGWTRVPAAREAPACQRPAPR
jgi:AcrR family transcriptional regulator